MLFPWMLDDYQELKLFKNAANILAKKKNWPRLYDPNVLVKNKVPIKAIFIQMICMLIEISRLIQLVKYKILIFGNLIYMNIMPLRSDGEILDILFQL